MNLPKIVELALRLPELIESPIPLLKKGKSHSLSLTQLQIASLLANGFLCTLPQGKAKDLNDYPGLNFIDMYEFRSNRRTDIHRITEKLKCIIHYFR